VVAAPKTPRATLRSSASPNGANSSRLAHISKSSPRFSALVAAGEGSYPELALVDARARRNHVNRGIGARKLLAIQRTSNARTEPPRSTPSRAPSVASREHLPRALGASGIFNRVGHAHLPAETRREGECCTSAK